ncbi:MAG: alanine racemase [Planctomycetota bacterium]|nr:alanine racemase [Planctomycetota bacterium]
MNRVIFDLNALKHNIERTNELLEGRGSSWTLVTKVLCGDPDVLKALQMLGVKSIADSRMTNFQSLERVIPDLEAWYLRIPGMSTVPQVIETCDVSLNTEISVIRALDKEARKQDKIHRIIMMIELGDLREGIMPGGLVNFYEQVFHLDNIELLGIGANLGCLSGAVPSIDQFMQLILYKQLLELKFERKIPLVSAGSTVTLPLVLDCSLPATINHFRIGEAVFLGTDLINGGTMEGYRNDVVVLEAEIAEIKKKGLVPLGETSDTVQPFDHDAPDDTSPGQRGFRALVSVGELDTDIRGLTPVNPDYKIAGGSSDIIVVNVGDSRDDLRVGDSIKFYPNYSALLRLMNSRYISKELDPPLTRFSNATSQRRSKVGPVVKDASAEENGE